MLLNGFGSLFGHTYSNELMGCISMYVNLEGNLGLRLSKLWPESFD